MTTTVLREDLPRFCMGSEWIVLPTENRDDALTLSLFYGTGVFVGLEPELTFLNYCHIPEAAQPVWDELKTLGLVRGPTPPSKLSEPKTAILLPKKIKRPSTRLREALRGK